MSKEINYKVGEQVWIVGYYDRPSRMWWAFYRDAEGNQIGDAWFDPCRDILLLIRPDVPALVAS
jgi:hypothetical protein